MRPLARCERELAQEPDKAVAAYTGANALAFLGERERALAWAKRALAIEPDDHLTLYNVACTYALLDELEDAMDLLERTMPSAGAHRLAWMQQDGDLDPLRDIHGTWPSSDRLRLRGLTARHFPFASNIVAAALSCAATTNGAASAPRSNWGADMKRRLLATVGLAVSAVLAASSAWAMVEQLGPGEGEVDIVAWPGYIERGETDKAYDWVTEFEKKTGCKVNVKTAGTSDEMVALMNEGGFDLVTASGDAIAAPDRRQARAGDQHRPDPELEHGRRRACRTRPGTRSTASTTACPTSGAPTC